MRTSETLILAIILIAFAISAYLYPALPAEMASHWNAQGVVDGYMSKFWGTFLMPLVSLGLFLLFVLIPRIDPLKKNIEKFRKYFDTFVVLIIIFLFYIHALSLAWNLGFMFSMTYMMIPAISFLFFYVGILVENAKRNWFIGIRTPWTLSSDKVWKKTHKLGGKLFKIAAVIALFGLLSEEYSIYIMLAPILFVAAYTIVYSYFEYQKEKR